MGQTAIAGLLDQWFSRRSQGFTSVEVRIAENALCCARTGFGSKYLGPCSVALMTPSRCAGTMFDRLHLPVLTTYGSLTRKNELV
jgi:hypothetical protein